MLGSRIMDLLDIVDQMSKKMNDTHMKVVDMVGGFVTVMLMMQ